MKFGFGKLKGLLPWHVAFCKKIVDGRISLPDNIEGKKVKVIAHFALESQADGDYELARTAYNRMLEDYESAFYRGTP